MWDRLLDKMLTRLLRQGALDMTFADGTSKRYGDQSAPVMVTLKDPKLARKLILNPELAMGEAYMEDTLTIGNNDLHGFLSLVMRNAKNADLGVIQRTATKARHSLRRIVQHNPLHIAKQNVEHHYDLSVDLYDLFLCDDKQYTCAYFPDPAMTLEAAQDAKKAHIAKKLCLESGMTVLDIGCGWGGTSIALARDHDVNVVGVTLSQVQLDHARKRAAAAGLSDKIEFRLMDYRDVTEEFDRIVVVGMLEHVGQPQYHRFFQQIRRNLAPDGIAVVHTIGRSTPPAALSPWFNKYIFPGGYSPAMSELMTPIEKNHLFATDIEVWRHHYVKTLRHWQQRFDSNIDAIRDLYDDRFCRMWRYYLVASELSFSELGMVVFQFQITRDQQAAPLTRDYMHGHGS